MQSEILRCPVARECGGCALIDLPYDDQLLDKGAAVRRAFGRWPRLDVDRVEPCLAAPVRHGYRNRAKLAVASFQGQLRVGLHRRGTNEVVDLAPCLVQCEAVQQGMERLRSWLARHSLAGPVGPVFYVDLREAGGAACHVTLVVRSAEEGQGLPLDELAATWPDLAGVAINVGREDSSYPMGAETRVVRGSGRFLAPLDGPDGRAREFEVPPGGFFQVAPSALAAVHRTMADHLAGSGTLLDLYCGVGVHGLVVASLASETTELHGVEESPALIDAARSNAKRWENARVHYHAGRVEELLADLMRAHPARRAIVNPGRSGCRGAVVEELARSAVERLAYLSCSPASLARDLDGLVAGGLRLTRVLPLDLMPQTDHVEVLALLER